MAFLTSMILAGNAFCFPADVEDISGEKYFPAVKAALAGAKKSIRVAMYIVELPAGVGTSRQQQLIDELINAHKRGVDVEVVLDRNIDERTARRGKLQTELKSIEAYRRLKAAGVKVFYDDPSRYTHAKAVVIDGETVILGSTNWSNAALNRNIEVNVLVKSEELARSTTDYLRSIEKSEAAEAEIGEGRPAVPVEARFMTGATYAPQMVNKNDERAFDIYLFLLWEYDGNSEGRISLFYDTAAEYLGMDTSNRTAYRRQIIKVLRKLEARYGLIRFKPLYAKEATITLVDLEDAGKADRGKSETASSFRGAGTPPDDRSFELPEAYFDYGWNRELSFSAKICYMINLINAGASDTRPVWLKSVAEITAAFGGIGADVIYKGMGELRRKRIIDVAYDDLTGKPYEKREPKTYKVLELYDFKKLQERLKELSQQYGEKEYGTARKYAEIVFEEYNPAVIEDIIVKGREYGQEKVGKAFAIVAQKNTDNPKKKYSYVAGILENWGK